MSGNVDKKFTQAQIGAAKGDRRVLNTRNKLGDALVELMQEKSFDEITVQDVLDRAGVGRSTFYAHYSDKQDLFMSDVEDFFRLMSTLLTRTKASRERIVPMREFLSHMADVGEFHAALVTSGKLRDVFELGQGFFVRSIKERLLLADVKMQSAELDAYAEAMAGAMFSQMMWWIDHKNLLSPEAMDALFHRMLWSGLGTSQP
jgi:AcrR family transcriptional regulator